MKPKIVISDQPDFVSAFRAGQGLKNKNWAMVDGKYRLMYAEDAEGNVVVKDTELMIRVLCAPAKTSLSSFVPQADQEKDEDSDYSE